MQNIINAATRKELKKELTFVTYYEIDNVRGYNTERGAVNYLKQLNEERAAEYTASPCHEIYITIRWSINGNPTATADVLFKNGEERTITAKCSGWGYDKTSTVLSQIINKVCKPNLYNARKRLNKSPYGIYYKTKRTTEDNFYIFVDGGIGESATAGCVRFLNGTLKHMTSAPSFDSYFIQF